MKGANVYKYAMVESCYFKLCACYLVQSDVISVSLSLSHV